MKINQQNWNYDDLRVMDLGTGDGKTIQMLHEKFKIPYSNMAGVTAEDMQGVKTSVHEDIYNLPEEGL